ncbi:MAG: hypothetical protein F6K53_12155 [Moorea sp. SIO4A1]|nr:hypothetical protein [Moorena sp. SIO4A3]NEQ58120.1 hypothetical protein [Moorena sp. SIO4A1]
MGILWNGHLARYNFRAGRMPTLLLFSAKTDATLPIPCSLLPAPYSLLPTPCSLLPMTLTYGLFFDSIIYRDYGLIKFN